MPAITSTVQPPTRTILLVEDEDSVREVTRYVLESAGYLVLEASSAEQGLAAFRRFEGSINLLLTDVVMPSMSGAELAARLKAMDPTFVTIFIHVWLFGQYRPGTIRPGPTELLHPKTL